MNPDELMLRRAFEALRAGVPNRAAVLLLGSMADAIEDRFEAGLQSAWAAARPPGLLFGGGFGAGKSHLLMFLREAALKQNFAVSTVSVSKETPLSAPASLFAAAWRNTIVPGQADDAMAVALARLQERPAAATALKAELSAPETRLSPLFAAVAHLLSRPLPPDTLRRLEMFLAGGKLPGPAIRQALAQAGARGKFNLTGLSEASLLRQRERFAPLLFRAAGFAGWCLLIDEVELIGRYSPLQRARAYAELARWLGLPGIQGVPGLMVAAAITDDFASQVIDGRQDGEKLPERLQMKGAPEEAALASAAMRAIAAAPVLQAPGEADLQRYAERLRASYGRAYAWEAPPLPVGERRANRTMRHHIRGWITQWDVLRLHGRMATVEEGTLAANYTETDDLSQPPPDDD